MKIFLAGETHRWSAETSYSRILREMGCNVFAWNNKRPRALFGNRSWWNLTRFERVAYNALASMAFGRSACAFQPDVIFLPKADNIHFRAVRRALDQTGARLVVWYPDNPFKADMTSMNVLRNIPRCSIFYIWGKFLVEPIRSAGCPDVRYLPFGFDPGMHPLDAEPNREDEQRFSCDVCFIGAWDREREEDLAPLAEFDLAIWGPGWAENLSQDSPLRSHVRGSGIYNRDLVKAYRCAKIVFNHLRQHNGPAHNNRTMEIAGIGGGVQLVRRTPEQAEGLFVEGEHLLCFHSVPEMRSQVVRILSDPQRSKEMSKRAQQRVFDRHLLAGRFKQMISDLQESEGD